MALVDYKSRPSNKCQEINISFTALDGEYLHDAVPVVSGGNLEEGEEGHPEVFKGGVSAHAFTGVVSVTH